jgi:hypothetical protein
MGTLDQESKLLNSTKIDILSDKANGRFVCY